MGPTLRDTSRTGATNLPLLLLGGVVVGASLFLLAYQLYRGSSGSAAGGANEFSYDLEALMEVDPALIFYEESGVFPTGLEEPRGIDAGPNGDAFAVVGDRALRIFDPEGNLLADLALDGEPRCVEVAPSGEYTIGFRSHVEIYDAEAKGRKAVWPDLGEGAVITSIAVGKTDTFVADAGQRVVWRCDASGRPVGEIGRKDRDGGIPGFFVPSPYMDLALAPDGLLRVVNPGRHRIEAYTPEGHLEFHWGKPSMAIDGFSGCCNPCNFALLPSGGFVTAEKGLPRVKVYDARGGFVGAVAGPASFAEGARALRQDWRKGSSGALDVAVDRKGRVLVLDPLAQNVRVFVKKKGLGMPAGTGVGENE